MGTGYKGGTTVFHGLEDNLPSIRADYPTNDGLFGNIGQSDNINIRNITSDSPELTAKDFYDKIAIGGKEKMLYYKDSTIKGYQTRMSDGTIINYRIKSSSDGSPAVDIDIQFSSKHGDIKSQKIHFVKRRQ